MFASLAGRARKDLRRKASRTERGLFGGVPGGRYNEEGKRSFLKKRTKKLLRGCRGLVGDSRAEVFASFFKKKRLPSLWPHHLQSQFRV